MKLGDYFKKYNIRFLGSSPKKIKTKIDGIDLEKIFEKRFYDLKLLLEKEDKDIIKFYIPEIGTIPNDLKIKAIDEFLEKKKYNQTIENLLNSSIKIIEDGNYYDLDWYKRDIKKILMKISENDLKSVNIFLLKLKNFNLEIYNDTIKIVKKLKEHNKILSMVNYE